MLEPSFSEILLIAVVAVVVIGPKDLPRTLMIVGRWVAKARGVSRNVRAGFDAMVREAELQELEKRWAEENDRIMRAHPVVDAAPRPEPSPMAPVALPPAERPADAE